MVEALYDRIGQGYARTRRTDPHIAGAIEAALGDAESVLNVGAGAGGYEPADRAVTAVEPSAEMIAQRPSGSAPVVQATAEALPFDDDSFDAAMAVMTVHHWPDLAAGLAELRRADDLWITSYFPTAPRGDRVEQVLAILPAAAVTPVPIPRDCTDLFFWALWARPELFLDDRVVQSMWVWNILDPAERERGRERLASDLADGTWDRDHGALRDLDELDVGVRLVTAAAS
jgi:SAM-dependent methyltransferase